MLPVALTGLALALAVLALAYLFWRHFWFFRNPRRTPPPGQGLLSPADGTVVYAHIVAPGEPVVCIKRGRKILLRDVAGRDEVETKLVIGVFMSPFDVHYNRAPLSGRVESIEHHPARTSNRNMGSMHWRVLTGKLPIYENSPHLMENERTVTRISARFQGRDVACAVVQIAGGSVRGIDSYVPVNGLVERGNIFGMIRVGSQVDTVITWHEAMRLKVRPGDRVRAGESVLVE